MEAALLHCPIRGGLRVRQRASDDLTFSEEKHRIDAIRYLLQRRYPKDNFGIETTLFRLGNDGRNSFRTDFAIYDRPYDDVRGMTLQKRLEHVRVLAEIKRDNSSAESAKAHQVCAALKLMPDIDTLGIYWDDIEQRFFYRRADGRLLEIFDAPISKIPDWGNAVGSTQLTFNDLSPAKDLVRIFDEIEDVFHTYIADKVERYVLIQQLLLTKIHDEAMHRPSNRHSQALDFQDFSTQAISNVEVGKRMGESLARAASHYNQYLPENKQIAESFNCPIEVLRNSSKILAPINILGSKVNVIQAFYMKFAKSLYKWDLAQYFTPHEVIDFIVELTNPFPDEHVQDPACGSADFLISAFRKTGSPTQNTVWGADNSEQAVQISILNMVLNGDGKTQIKHEDSLASFGAKSRKYSVVLCNPPFGTKIVERRFEVLRKFEMGHRWLKEAGGASITDEVRPSQQTGILFAELCVKLTEPGGRIGLILPNGYLGNRTIEYLALREWLLRHTKVVAIVAFPRFTFKKSGADVSASVLVLEKRRQPLDSASKSRDYQFYAGNIESVGWRAGDKTAVPTYKRDQNNGALILDDSNEPILDADFTEVLHEFLRSGAADCFPWTRRERELPVGKQHAAVDIETVASQVNLNMDPKRHSAKFRHLQQSIKKIPHFLLGDVLELAPLGRPKIRPDGLYRYVEIEPIGIGEYDFEEMRGWQLPQRARLPAVAGDFYVAHLWSSAGKWFRAPRDCEDTLVTNGCAHFRLRSGADHLLPDLVVGLSSESFCIQLRALATGSDGLAEISDDDMLSIVLPKISDSEARVKVDRQIAAMWEGEARLSKVAQAIIDKTSGYVNPSKRKSHCSLV